MSDLVMKVLIFKISVLVNLVTPVVTMVTADLKLQDPTFWEQRKLLEWKKWQSEADINKITLQTLTLDYIQHRSL